MRICWQLKEVEIYSTLVGQVRILVKADMSRYSNVVQTEYIARFHFLAADASYSTRSHACYIE